MSSVLSSEQQAAVDAALRGENVRVRAVPGAGKTFTCLRIAEALENKGRKVLQLTYSAALKHEWRKKRGGIENLDGLSVPHSFHSFARRIASAISFDGTMHENLEMRRMLAHSPTCSLPEYLIADAIIIDETQDCTPLFRELLTFYSNLCAGAKFQLVVVGQEDQCVYKNGTGGRTPEDEKASLSYLTEDTAFESILHTCDWTECPFTMSYRLTPVTANAINALFGTSIVGCNTRSQTRKPRHICIDTFEHQKIADLVAEHIREYGAEHVQLVAPSWKESGDGPPKNVRNCLTRMGFLFVDSKDVNRSGKTGFYTCPGVKGTEAKCSIVFADRFCDHFVTHPQKFVAMTRASEQLVVIQNRRNAPWLVETPDEMRNKGFDVKIVHPFKPENRDDEPQSMEVTDLLRSAAALKRLVDMHSTTKEDASAESALDVQKSVSFATHTEDLARINGMVVPFAFAVEDYQTAPGFERIFESQVIVRAQHFGKDAAKNGENAVTATAKLMAENGHIFPKRDEFMKRLTRFVRLSSEQQISLAIKNHLRSHGFFEYASMVTTASQYEVAFPLSQRLVLESVNSTSVEDWDLEMTAHAALASNAFGADHYTLAQVCNYKWVNKQISFFHECRHRIKELLLSSASVAFEVSVGFTQDPKMYPNLPYGICGLHGRIDCIEDTHHVFEYKLKESLEEADFVQLFIYLCLQAHHLKCAPDRLQGTLFNVRTNERHDMRLASNMPVEKVLSAIIDIHCATDLDLETILASTGPIRSTQTKSKRNRVMQGAEEGAGPRRSTRLRG